MSRPEAVQAPVIARRQRARHERKIVAQRATFVRATLIACALLLVVGAVLISASGASAQQAGIFYVYDDLNRLIAVVDPQGNAATYTYDATGNLLRVDRFDAGQQPGPVRITLVTPTAGKVGTHVQIFGTGFSPTPAQDSVTFAGTGASVTDAGPTRLMTTVPSGAATGTISVTAPLGSATSQAVFRVLGPGEVTVTPSSASVFVSRSQQFQALEAGTATTNVRWTVNGLPGGDTTVGTITADGLYTAPATAPTPSIVTVTAIHKDDPTDSASASVTIFPPQPVFLAARGVSVGLAEARTVDKNVAATVSVGVVQSPAAFAAAAPTVVAIAPVVTAVTPASGARGEALALTLSGSGFSGATAVTLLLNNATDTTITVVNLTVNADGTQATVDIAIDASAPLGARVVQLTTPGGSSTAAGTGGNLFTVQ